MKHDFINWAGKQIAGGVIGSTILKALAQRVDDEGGCIVTRNELIGVTHYSESTILRWLTALEKRKLIHTQIITKGRSRFWQVRLEVGAGSKEQEEEKK